MSFPWILTEHIIKSQHTSKPLLEKLCFVLDVYNDAASRALHVLEQQFLYDEIEAEVGRLAWRGRGAIDNVVD